MDSAGSEVQHGDDEDDDDGDDDEEQEEHEQSASTRIPDDELVFERDFFVCRGRPIPAEVEARHVYGRTGKPLAMSRWEVIHREESSSESSAPMDDIEERFQALDVLDDAQTLQQGRALQEFAAQDWFLGFFQDIQRRRPAFQWQPNQLRMLEYFQTLSRVIRQQRNLEQVVYGGDCVICLAIGPRRRAPTRVSISVLNNIFFFALNEAFMYKYGVVRNTHPKASRTLVCDFKFNYIYRFVIGQ